MTEYVGWCTEPLTGPTQWGPGDVQGVLMMKVGDGWRVVSSHYCSSVYARGDIERWHYEPRASKGDTYEWIGVLSPEAAEARFPKASDELKAAKP